MSKLERRGIGQVEGQRGCGEEVKLLSQEQGQEGKQKTTADVRVPGRVFRPQKLHVRLCRVENGAGSL